MSDKQINNEVIYFDNVRLSFPHLAEPQRSKNAITGFEKVTYNVALLFPPNDPAWLKFWQRCADLVAAKWKENAASVINTINAERKQRCYGRGEEIVNKNTFQPYDGYPGAYYINASCDAAKRKPQIIQADGTPAPDIAYNDLTRKMYGGCRVNAAVKPWLQNNQEGGRGIRCELIAIQFAGDDTPFGDGPIDVTEMFGATAPPAAGPTPAGAPFGPPATAAMPAPPFSGAPGLPSFLS